MKPALPLFRDRADAGEALGLSLRKFVREPDVIVLGLARGGVPIAQKVASTLGAPLGVLVSQKIGVPGIEEVPLGAIAEGSDGVATDSVAWYIGVPSHALSMLAERERGELERRALVYRSGHALPSLRGRFVIVVDDGVATGTTLRAAARAIRRQKPRRLIAAVPIASRLGSKELRGDVDELIAIVTPEQFTTIAAAYRDYPTMSGEADVGSRSHRERTLEIPVHRGSVPADLGLPGTMSLTAMRTTDGARGLAILAHGCGSSRNSYRNRYIAGRLRLSGYATLRVDLLTCEEQRVEGNNSSKRFDVERMAARLANVCDWAASEGIDGAHRIILAGAGTGAAVALSAASRRPGRIFAIAACAGRVDLAADVLPCVDAPVMLIVGEADPETLRVNQAAMRSLPRTARLIRVPRAGHTFDEPGSLGAAAENIVKWLDHLSGALQGGQRISSPRALLLG
jgi:putative phosphoribosyl transferase